MPVWSRIVLLQGVQSSGSEFGERTRPNPGSEFGFGVRIWPYPGSAGSEFGERNGPNPGSAGSEFRERNRTNPGSEFKKGQG